MKQKWKVKSLLPHKQNEQNYLMTAILLILSLMLCIGTAALITSSVGASGNPVVNNSLDYEGFADNKETVYGIKFADPLNLSSTIGDISIQDKSLYISSNSVLVNYNNCGEKCNKINTGIHSHILGGSENSINSNNVTIIGGTNIEVMTNNENSTIVGGKNNKISTGYNNPMVSIGGSGNVSHGSNLGGVTLIGGSGNTIGTRVDGGVIIGGEKNTINSYAKNVLIGGKNITVEISKKNVFVYSNSGTLFKPGTGNAFYLNMDKGVGVNTTSNDKGLFVNGPVEIKDLSSDRDRNTPCNSGNLGVITSFQGCIIGCTKVGMDQGKWELLNGGGKCGDLFTNDPYSGKVVTYTEDDEPIIVEDTNAQCTNNVNTGNAVLCKNASGESLDLYKNVIFETALIDSDVPCPEHNLNQCIYRCNQDYHLTGKNETLRCYKDCELPWDKTQKIIHNTTITAYNITGVSCSNDIYVFPLKTEIINRGVPALSPTGITPPIDIVVGNVTYHNRAANGKSPETCRSHDHKKTLKCNDGVLELMDAAGKTIPNSSGDAKLYKYESCDLYKYECNTGVYSLTQTQIINDRFDRPQNNNRDIADRGRLEGVRGKYNACIDYGVNPNPTKNGESCTKGEYHYEFIGCQNGYHTGKNYENICRKDCTLKNLNGSSKSYVHLTQVTGYKNNSVTCTGTCQDARLICNDGKWEIDGQETTLYPYNDCQLKSYTCSTYPVTLATMNQWSGTSKYNSCDPYVASGQFLCVKQETKYKLTGCYDGHHTENSQYCKKNREIRDCSSPSGTHRYRARSGGNVVDYPWYDVFKGINISNSQYLRVWNKAWNASNGWSSTKYPLGVACEWLCDDGYHKSGNSCVKNTCSGTTPGGDVNGLIKSNNTRPSGSGDLKWDYVDYTDGMSASSLGVCEWTCKTGYHKDGNKCYADKKTVSCDSKPDSATWVNDKYEQTWNGSEWSPSTKSSKCVTSSTNAPECSFACKQNYTCNESGTGCRTIEYGVCDNSRMWGCGNENDRVVDTGATLLGPTWFCKSRDGRLSAQCQYECTDGIFTGGACTPLECHHCAKSGFPYCYPIDFSEDCKEISTVSCVNNHYYKECSDGITGSPTSGSDPSKVYWMCGSEKCEMCDIDRGYTYDGDTCEYRCTDDNTDYGTISIANPDNTTQGFTIMDRDLGAITAGGQGWLYQWGNNYGFPSNYSSVSARIEELVDTTGYGLNNPYCKGAYVSKPYPGWGDYHWISAGNFNLWGGLNDTSSNNWGLDPTTHKATNLELKKGPCPDGWHVPSVGEWSLLLKYFVKSKLPYSYDYMFDGTNGGYVLNNSSTDGGPRKFTDYFKMSGTKLWLSATAKEYFANGPSSNIYIASSEFHPIRPTLAAVRCFKDDYEPSEGPQCGSATTDNGMPRKNKDNLCAEGNYSDGKVVFDRNGRFNNNCTPHYEWKCNKGGKSISCGNEGIYYAGVSVRYPDGARDKWSLGEHFSSTYPYYVLDSDVTDGISLNVVGYADADPEGPNTSVLVPNLNSLFQSTLEAGTEYTAQEITGWPDNSLYCFVGMDFNQKIYTDRYGQEYVLFPTTDRSHNTAFTNCVAHLCPSDFALDPS